MATYVQLRQIAAASDGRLRAWRTTHFGGHVFAPTLMDMPHGSYWAYIEREEAECLITRSGDFTRLRDHYRGWSGLPAPFLQVLERELFVRHGWAWLAYAKSGCTLAQDETAHPDEHGHTKPTWAEVRLDYMAPDGNTGVVTARVELTTHIEVIPSTGSEDLHKKQLLERLNQQQEPIVPATTASAYSNTNYWLLIHSVFLQTTMICFQRLRLQLLLCAGRVQSMR